MDEKIIKERRSIFYLLVIIIAFISSCNSNKDPIQASDFKYLSQNELVQVLTQKKVLEIEYNLNEIYDTLYFFNLNKDDNLKSVLWINPEEYHFDKVNSLKINFGSDSVMLFGQMIYSPGKGFTEKKKVDKILDIYLTYFGKPDAVLDRSIEEMTLIDNVFLKLKEENKGKEKIDLSNYVDIRDVQNIYKYYVWELNEYKIMICSFSSFSDSSLHSGFIKYEVNDLAKILNSKREEIRKNARLNDFINMELNLSPFTESSKKNYTDRMNIVGFSVGHILPEESRSIKQFKFNLIIENEYKDILLTINDLELTLDYPLKSPSNGVFSTKRDQFYWTVDYNRYVAASNNFENLRILMERKIEQGRFNDIKLRHELTAIIFEDGEVLKKENK